MAETMTYEEAREIALAVMDEDDENDISDSGCYHSDGWFSKKVMYHTIIAALTGDY